MADKIHAIESSTGDIMAKLGRPKKATNATTTPAAAPGGRPSNANGETTSGYFRNVFKENPKLLVTRSNSEVLSRWLADHPGSNEVPPNVQKSMAKVKGLLRKKSRQRGRSTAVEQGAAVAATNSEPKTLVRMAPKNLETLEERKRSAPAA